MKNIEINQKEVNNSDYKSLVQELQSIISQGQHQAYKTVDNIKVQAYWQIGERIVREEMKNKERAKYEEYLINNLTIDLGIGRRLLYEIINFYRVYPIVHTVCAQLSWSHLRLLIKLNNDKERNYYENKTIINSWSVRELIKQIKNNLYQKTDDKEKKDILKNILPTVIDITKIFKSEYNFNFLEITPTHLENELENKIVHNIKHFLKELGEDFMFLGQQVPILIDGEKHCIDLVLFHRGIPCVILVDLKIGKLDSRDIGQMNKYLGYFRHNKQYAYEQDAIGLIICREAGQEEIVYALDGLEEKIFVAIYKHKLPSAAKIKEALKGI